MEITIMETSAYLELKRQLSTLSVQMEEFNRKTAPPSPDKWIDAQEVCQALGISKRCLQAHRNRGLIPCSISVENISTVKRTYRKYWKKV